MAVPVPTGGQIMTGGTAEGRDRLKTMDWDELGYSRNNALWLRLPETPHRPQQKTADGPLLDRPFLPRSRYFSHTKPSALSITIAILQKTTSLSLSYQTTRGEEPANSATFSANPDP